MIDDSNKDKQSNKEVKVKKSITIYCHFSFRRPKGKRYGLFAVAFYSDYEGKKLLVSKTRKLDLWCDQQFITAIQSYENALFTISELQGYMLQGGISQVMLVTDNSTLAGWIEKPNKNKGYTEYMKRAVRQYRVGETREIVLGVGLCDARDSEKSYKYCTEERVSNDYRDSEETVTGYKLNIEDYKSIDEIIKDDISIPQTTGITELGTNNI